MQSDKAGCPYNPLLSALHDGELDLEASQRLERHLTTCAACAEALREIRLLSGAVSNAGAADRSDLSANELARLHDAIDEFGEAGGRRGLLTTAWTLLAVAASILLIGSAWLWDIPRAGPAGATRPGAVSVRPRPAPEWERVAAMLRVDPPVRTGGEWPDDTALADARLAEEMVAHLSGMRNATGNGRHAND